jgi:hypothetical protein
VRTSDLSPELLAALRMPRPYPAITFVLPTDPDSPFSEKTRILLRDLVTDAQRKLAEDPEVDRDVRLTLRNQVLDADAIEQAGDPGHPSDAMIVFLAADEPVQVWQVASPQDVRPRTEFAGRFLTRYLVDAEQRSRPYLVLVLDQDLCRLYRGAVDRLAEVREHGFPAPPEIPSPEDAVPGPIPHSAPYEGHEEHVKKYLRAVDRHLGEALAAHGGLPLFVIGGDKILAAFQAVTGHGDRVVGTLQLTGMNTDRPAEVARHLAPALDKFRAEQIAEAEAELDRARSGERYAGGIAQVWTAVADKRVQWLVIEESLVLAGRITLDGRTLETVPYPEPVTMPDPKQDVAPPREDVVTDVVERLVEGAIDADGRVLFVPEGTLADSGGVAASLRY